MPKTNGKKKSPSVERQLALATVWLIESFEAFRDVPQGESGVIQKQTYENSMETARTLLKENGYADLECTPCPVCGYLLK